MEQPIRKCYGCQRPLDQGVRFCVACGKHNFDPDSANLMVAKSDIKAHKTKVFLQKFSYWWRWFSGIRR